MDVDKDSVKSEEKVGKTIDEIIKSHRALVCHQIKSLSGIVESHSKLNKPSDAEEKSFDSAFYFKRRRLMAHLKQRNPINDNGLTDVEIVIRACIDRKGRLSCPPVVEYFVQAMWEAQNVEDWSLLLSVLESSRKCKQSLETFVDIGGCSVLREWVLRVFESTSKEKKYRPTKLIFRLLKVFQMLPITYEAFLHIRKHDIIDTISKDSSEPFLGEKEIEQVALKLKDQWTRIEQENGDKWLEMVNRMRQTSAQNIEREQRAAKEAREKEEAAREAKAASESYKKRPAPSLSYSSQMANYKNHLYSPPKGRMKDSAGKPVPSKKSSAKLDHESFIPDDVDPVRLQELNFENMTEEERLSQLRALNFDNDDEMDVDQFAMEPSVSTPSKKNLKVKWADQISQSLREVREYWVDDTPAEVLKAQRKEQLEHHEANKWKALVRIEREDERAHIGHSSHSRPSRGEAEKTRMKPKMKFYQPGKYPGSDSIEARPHTAEYVARVNACKLNQVEIHLTPGEALPNPSEEGVVKIPLSSSKPVPSISLLTAEEEEENTADLSTGDSLEDDNLSDPIQQSRQIISEYGIPPPPPPPTLVQNSHVQDFDLSNQQAYNYHSDLMDIVPDPHSQYEVPPLQQQQQQQQQQNNYQLHDSQYSHTSMTERNFNTQLPPPRMFEQEYSDTVYQHQAGYFEDERSQPNRGLHRGDMYYLPPNNQEFFPPQNFDHTGSSIVPTIGSKEKPCIFWTKWSKICKSADQCHFIHDNNYDPPPMTHSSGSRRGRGRMHGGIRGRGSYGIRGRGRGAPF